MKKHAARITETTFKRALTTQRRAVERGEEPPEWTKVVLAEVGRLLGKRPRKPRVAAKGS